MKLAAALLPLLPREGVVAFVGAGGKTSSLFSLGLALEAEGRSVLLTSTTHLMDPRLEPSRPVLHLRLRPELEAPMGTLPIPEAPPGLTMLMAREAGTPGKLKGIHPSWIGALRASWPWILVEADGSKGLPVKAPAPHEPVIPPGADLVVGILGLDGLGRPMDVRTVHRPEHFSAVTGCQPGEAIAWEHLAALVAHPQGLFKDAPGRRVLFLNKGDKAQALPGAPQLAHLPVDRVLLGSLEPREAVMVFQRGRLL